MGKKIRLRSKIRLWPPCWPKGSKLCTILWNLFLVTFPKNYLTALSAQIYTNSEWRGRNARAERTHFLVNTFFGLFFQNFACGAEGLAKLGPFYCFGRARKIKQVDLTKSLENIRNSAPLEKILDPPLPTTTWNNWKCKLFKELNRTVGIKWIKWDNFFTFFRHGVPCWGTVLF